MSDDIGDNEPITLAEAAKLFFGGRLTKSALRTEVAKGNLEIIRIANKDFVTRNMVNAMIERCKVPTREPSQPKGNLMTAQDVLRHRLANRHKT